MPASPVTKWLVVGPQSAGETDVKFSKGGLATDDSLCVGAWERAAFFVAHRSDELVSPSGKGLNICRLFGVVAKSLADSANILLDDFRIHVSLGPDGLKNLVLRDETFCVFHEIRSTSNALGVRGTRSSACQRQWFTVSSRNGWKAFIAGP